MAARILLLLFLILLPSFVWADFRCREFVVDLSQHSSTRIVRLSGDFKTDGYLALLHPDISDARDLEKWSSIVVNPGGEVEIISPPESARSVLLPLQPSLPFRDVLNKGTGLVSDHVINNRLRPIERGFNGKLELSAACRDFVYNEILEELGARVSKPLSVFDRNEVFDFGSFSESTASFSKAFRNQTRLSNLAAMTPSERKIEIDRAMERLRNDEHISVQTYSDYFNYLLDRAAYNAALYQSSGLTQDSLHSGQMTLAGEMTDFEIGNLNLPNDNPYNTLHPWFRFERQPLVLLNMLFRTHSLKAEPTPARLGPESPTVREQETMFGFLRSIHAPAAEEIKRSDPERRFWAQFHRYAKEFDEKNVRATALKLLRENFSFKSEAYLSAIPSDKQRLVVAKFDADIRNLKKHFEQQGGPWPRLGLPARLQYSILKQVASKFGYILSEFAKEKSVEVNVSHSSGTNLTWQPKDLPLEPSQQIYLLAAKFPENIRVVSAVVQDPNDPTLKKFVRHEVVLISTKDLNDADRDEIQVSYNSAFDTHLGILVSHQDPDAHTFLRWRGRALDYVFFDEFSGSNAKVRSRDQRLARKLRLDVEIPLIGSELARWQNYVDRVLTNRDYVLGRPPTVTPGSNAGVTVLSRATRRSIEDNRFIDGCSNHNCLTWASLAPIGDRGEQLVDLLGFSDQDFKSEAHSWTVAFARRMFRVQSRSEGTVFVLQANENLDELERELLDPTYLPSLIRKPPDPD